MKKLLPVSLILNLVLLAGLIYFRSRQLQPALTPTAGRPPTAITPAPAPTANPVATAVSSPNETGPFRWSQLESPDNIRDYIANLRAIGCPELTIKDIVGGVTARAFSWERRQLGLDGSGSGMWSRLRESQLVASLLEVTPVASGPALAQNVQGPASNDASPQATVATPAGTTPGSPQYPLFLQATNWSAFGFTPAQQTAIGQVRQQFLNQTAGLEANPGGTAGQTANATGATDPATSPTASDSAAVTDWEKALQDANDQLRESLGGQGYLAYEQQQYLAWFKTQQAAAGNGSLIINPAGF